MIDWKKIGLKFGIEIHQRLDTHKLFCQCSSGIENEKPDFRFKRNLRAIFGELGEIDAAALFEFTRERDFIYQHFDGESCTVEMDDEPPQPMNPDALDIGLKVGLILDCKIPDEIFVMRKTVIDGSNTSGFQRTSVIGLDGELDMDSEKISISTVCLEEESAGIAETRTNEVTYSLNRLAIPLVEIATGIIEGPPEKAKKVSKKLGMILRGTGKVQRGIGTIRQDLNVSVRGGRRTEIKGVQALDLIPQYIENEAIRQLSLISIKNELEKRKIKSSDIKEKIEEITDIFNNTKSSLIRKSLDSGLKIYAIKLPKFENIFSMEIYPGKTLGREMADIVKVEPGVRGIIHTDELPAYGITEREVMSICKKMGAGKDLVVICIEKDKRAKKALKAILNRAKTLPLGVPKEVRKALPDGGTGYMRPLPGAARMYPETDVVPIVITRGYLDKLKETLPTDPDKIINKLVKTGISENLAREIFLSGKTDLYLDSLDYISSTLAASTLIETTQYLKREKVNVDKIKDQKYLEMFNAISRNKVAKEVIPDILIELSTNPNLSIDKIIKKLRLQSMGEARLEEIIDTIIDNKRDYIRGQGDRAIGGLMGLVMREVKGKVDGKLVSELLKKKLRIALKK
jgi:glutamyl-tRNA(Gln) amidotransferase subunit E